MKKRDTYEPILIRELPMLRLVIGSVSQFLSVSSSIHLSPLLSFFFKVKKKEGKDKIDGDRYL